MRSKLPFGLSASWQLKQYWSSTSRVGGAVCPNPERDNVNAQIASRIGTQWRLIFFTDTSSVLGDESTGK